ncbi:MAG TPA: SRPBCC family protein [Gemmatimonadaceae bacterium]|nr:SRPBCC family protein [Gemmatimonadaceae bacterium]
MQGNKSSAFVEARATVRASADRVYDLIADYRVGHPRIIPPKYFRGLEVERGGRGEGTIITYEMKLLGKVRKARARVSEPNPGRVLVETVEGQNIVTTFRVEPVGAFKSDVTISSVVPTRTGMLGALERALVRRLLAPIYRDELALLDSVAVGDKALRRTQ